MNNKSEESEKTPYICLVCRDAKEKFAPMKPGAFQDGKGGIVVNGLVCTQNSDHAVAISDYNLYLKGDKPAVWLKDRIKKVTDGKITDRLKKHLWI